MNDKPGESRGGRRAEKDAAGAHAPTPAAAPVSERVLRCRRGVLRPIAGLLAALGMAFAARSAGTPPGDLIGAPTADIIGQDDTLLDAARRHDVGFIELRLANPGADPWLPGKGQWINVPAQHILPPAPRRGIVINLPELRLYYFPPGKGTPLSFPIGIGDEGKDTPTGRTSITAKRTNPSWTPTASEHAENPDLPDVVKPGPDNPMGDFALYLAWKGFAIHGSNKPYSIGRRDSHGCIRMYPEDIQTLYRLVQPATPVTVINQPVKTGWQEGELYLEIHPDVADANVIESGGTPQLPAPADTDALVLRAAGPRDAPRIDWDAVLSAELERNGMPVRVTRPD